MAFEIDRSETTQNVGSDMDLTANDFLEMAPALASESENEEPSMGAAGQSNGARERALDASGPLWPLALNGWMPLDRLPVQHAKAAAVPAPSSGAAS